jgi:hypothetical protein
MPELLGDSILAWSITSKDSTPDGRARYADAVNAAWALLAMAFGVAMVVFGYLAQVLLGDAAANLVAAVALGGAFFCLAGCTNALWRKHYARQARRRHHTYGTDSEQYARSMERSLPRDTSLVFQAVVAIFVAVVTATS